MKSHFFLNNPRGVQKQFNASRYVETNEYVSEKDPLKYKRQKNALRQALTVFNSERGQRREARTLDILSHIEYIEIDFFDVFNNNEPFKTKSRFRNDFGLIPVSYTNFNQTVLFAIVDETKFKAFKTLLLRFSNSPDHILPADAGYGIITLILDFRLLSSASMLKDTPESDVVLSLVQSVEEIAEPFGNIYDSLERFLRNEYPAVEMTTDGISSVELKNITNEAIRQLADNFDIVYKIQSLRVPTIKANAQNIPELTWNFTVQAPTNKVSIGVLDNGVRPITPLKHLLIDHQLDITNPGSPQALHAAHPHGTIVASLAAIGPDFFDTTKTTFDAEAMIVPIKILEFDRGYFNIYDIKKAITQAIAKGVRIFNLSVCGPGKMYNSTVSEYAFMLDQLAYEHDILIFIAAGNLPHNDVQAMQDFPANGKSKTLHDYPNHFYNPNKLSDYHSCEATNICIPGESYNNITVGAIADNLYPASGVRGIAPLKELPAVYTRKSHIDYNRKINNTAFRRKQMNLNINKPDIVMPGGDMLDIHAGMQVIGFGDHGTDYYTREAGTSLATPLAANLAAKIVSLYPGLTMQSVKSLIIHNAKQLLDATFLDGLIDELKNEAAKEKFGKKFNMLSTKEAKVINERLKSEDLYRKIVGYGLPKMEDCLYSTKKSVTTIIQDNITADTYKVINLNIPKYLRKYSKNSYIVTLKATLCYKFAPVWNNQLGYNPLHISFNFVRSLRKDNPAQSAHILADSEHPFYAGIYSSSDTPEQKAKAKKRALGIKTSLESWSEDFFPPSSKPFSNTQKIDLNIKVAELKKIAHQVSIAVRCTYKRDIDKETLRHIKEAAHDFSISLTISEKPNKELIEYDLYDELENCNVLEVISEVELDAEQQGDGDAILDDE